MGAEGSKQLEDSMFQLKFTAKSMSRLSKNAEKEAKEQERKVKKSLENGQVEMARIYAENAVRKKNESINYLRMSAKVDAVASRVQSAHKMKGVSHSMRNVVNSLEKAVNSMELQKISETMDKFESQFEDLDVKTSVMEDTMGSATTLSTPQHAVDDLIKRVADEAGLEVSEQLANAPSTTVGEATTDQDALSKRLAALRE
ncbi:CHMP1 [Lepeophtheirus salmonis]|uniref:CHMP1 n=2 Tax=Lepeophtheirus salmonis TaxID=72036 RepID=C1BT67_LEPSM|nr:charged multivesicular body protein 1a-like [Lepeophtheirus salmonis]XP_040581904.1 charged multivesicular body protein 1a-like [Lepeophtheirus salmonis]ACO12220.1 Charged multivesicular body protein 1a [Lepeophtheirus salmonis]ADD24545.1 Charged multivesicular body protein 1a [Lepeophtheirus salmonis]ADD37975.1 Charged multivesicular body protein 1a [Lepeophtheirus salmonis]CAB4060020.1 CHMP1 [Lepeophtheirus salmonis]CAF2859010.1 CHMP1 [Lepeophtheirus salmonis]